MLFGVCLIWLIEMISQFRLALNSPPPTSVSQMLGLQTWASKLGSKCGVIQKQKQKNVVFIEGVSDGFSAECKCTWQIKYSPSRAQTRSLPTTKLQRDPLALESPTGSCFGGSWPSPWSSAWFVQPDTYKLMIITASWQVFPCMCLWLRLWVRLLLPKAWKEALVTSWGWRDGSAGESIAWGLDPSTNCQSWVSLCLPVTLALREVESEGWLGLVVFQPGFMGRSCLKETRWTVIEDDTWYLLASVCMHT